MKLFKLILSALVVMGLSSCLGSGSNTVTQDFSSYTLTYITDLNSGVSSLNSEATYKVYNNVDEGTMSVEIGSLKLPNGTYVSLAIPDTRYSYNEQGAMTMSIPSCISSVAGITHTITDLKFEFYSRYYGSQAFPMLVMSFNLDASNMVRVIYNPAYYWGTTVVTDQDGNSFTNDNQSTFYGIQFMPDKNNATVGVFNAKFAEGMPAMNMTFKDIPYTINQSGYDCTIAELTPTIGDTPYPSYKITDFRMSGMWGGTQVVSFTCTIDTEKLKGTYNVVANLTIIPSSSNNQNNN